MSDKKKFKHLDVPATNFFACKHEFRANGASVAEELLRERCNEILSWMQPGLVYPAPFQTAISIFQLSSNIHRADFASVVSEVRRSIHSTYGSVHGSVCVAFSMATWERFCSEDGRATPEGMRFAQPSQSDPFEPQVIERSNGVLRSSGADAWFIVKADEEAAVAGISDELVRRLLTWGLTLDKLYRVDMRSRNPASTQKPAKGGRVLGGRFNENLRNPASPVEVLEHVLVGGEDPDSAGGAFLFTQRFQINWNEIHGKTTHEIESMVGRRQYTNELIPSFDTNSHVRRAHTYDESGNTIKLLRIGLPFGRRTSVPGSSPLVESAGSSSVSDEAGIYFIGMARSAERIEAILQSQFGRSDNVLFAQDRLLSGNTARSDLGGFFYAPSVRELGAEAHQSDAIRRTESPFKDWKRFPGVDWSRFNRHYEKRSTNGRMYYNHQDYLFTIGTTTRDGLPPTSSPPSMRVQFLLERLFSKWDDTWFRSQKPSELAPLRKQLEQFFSRAENQMECAEIIGDAGAVDAAEAAANKIMQLSVALRSAWSGRVLCNIASRLDGVGRRGEGGMDLCEIHPLDLLAGSMPAQSLAEGRYFIDYAKDDDGDQERYRWYTMGLGPNSGVGHVVPGYEELLASGISGVFARIDAAATALTQSDPARAAVAGDFYASVRLAAKGLSEYLRNLADTVADRAARLRPGQAIEKKNLAGLEARLRWLAAGNAPRTLLEALQLVFAAHATIHLLGEPVAVGRLDRLLRPFQARENLDEADLQEAIDCFWLKLAEKVLLNRIFIDDRQQLGNMAMGNRSGPYPKGQSVNQWIQQLTVGGRNADGTWECSPVTYACIRASARLPFNAPVLSLRVSKHIPADQRAKLLEEAAHAQLSGGANPILMNDDKIIPALVASGDDIGPAATSPNASLWNSKVRFEDAHDYAADGCYEPQFVGANWFTLGGAIMLQPLEYALNQGRQILGAGAVDLLGRNMSFRSEPATELVTYDQIEALFFKHFEWMYARQVEGTVADFGRMEQICPAPLLDLFINDCLSKGRDIYGGGARYNVFGPCFTALANTINALWAIKVMCFEASSAVSSLPELVQALLCNWGETLIDPLVHPTVLASDPTRVQEAAKRFKYLREVALSLPRWGRGAPEIDAFGNRIAAQVAAIAVKVMKQPRPALAAMYETAATRFGTKTHPFGGFSMQPGVGTFASYVEQGLNCGASGDGRLSGQPLATDMSPTPSPLDMPANQASQQIADGVRVLHGMTSSDSFGYANGAPIDFNIAEDMPVQRLVAILDAFTDGAGSNVLTITTADQETFLAAASSPESYDLLRVRMGGWTEMFVAMHATHQKVHPRRPYSI